MPSKTVAIFEAMSRSRSCTVKSLSDDTGIPHSTVHRILRDLQASGVVMHTKKSGYSLTPKLMAIGLNGIAERELLDIAIPVMRRLSHESKETISYNVICGCERVCVYRIEGTQSITRNIRIGSTASLFRGSAGKILAANLNREEQLKIIDANIQAGMLDAGDVPQILVELENIKRDGYAFSAGERLISGASVAVPIKDMLGNIEASLSISTLESRFTADAKIQFLRLLFGAVEEIEHSYGLVT